MAKIQGNLTLIGDNFDTAYVSRMIGQFPPYVREKTEVLRNGQFFGHCEWGVGTEFVETDDLPPVSNLLRGMINCPTEVLKKVAQDCNAVWNILFNVDVYDDFPALFFDQEFIQFTAEIGGKIGFDVLLLNGPDPCEEMDS